MVLSKLMWVMAPGTMAMLRARRRDANVKPNRQLDRSSSRGMIYENEELRLRTININAEVERGQSDIKKLRKENETLRREIWGLREECDRLQTLLNKSEEEDDEEEDEAEEDREDEDGVDDRVEEEMERPPWCKFNGVDELSVVAEEPEEESDTSHPTPAQVLENDERRCEKYTGTLPPCLRVNCVHPFTVAGTIDYRLLPGLTVMEVIEATCGVVDPFRIEGVRLVTGGGCYISVSTKDDVEKLVEKGIILRETVALPLIDISVGTVVLAMSGVPHSMSDSKLAQTLNQFGPVIGYIESRYYRNVDTGERLARIKPQNSIPKRLYIDGQEISIRMLPHNELHQLTMLPANIVRGNNLHIQISVPRESKNETSGVPSTTAAGTSGEGFDFPLAGGLAANRDDAERRHSFPPIPSPQIGRRRSSENEENLKKIRYRNSKRGPSPGSAAGQDSSPGSKPMRRKSSVAGRRKASIIDQYELGTASERERSNSISSRTSCRRKLSLTGRESGKLPWCGCWGNGCF